MCFRFRSFPFPSASFRPLPFRFWLLSPLFLLFPLLLCSASQWVSRCSASAFRLLQSFPFRSAWFPMLRFRSSVLSFLFVSFRPSQLRSHSRSTGAYLVLSLSVLVPSLSAFFRPLLSRVRLLSLRLFFSLLPALPWRGSCGARLSPFFSACCHAYLPGLVLSLLRFLSPGLCIASQRLVQSLGLSLRLSASSP